MKLGFAKSLLLGFLILLSSCSEFQRIQKSSDVNKKLEAAMKYYEKKDNYKANVLLEEIMPLLKGRPEAEKAQFVFANTYFNDKQYIMSGYYFKDLYETYPRSEYAEQSMYMHVKSLYMDSPSFKLDQGNTDEALQTIQMFGVRYPQSSYMEEVNRMTDELNAKTEYKAFENAKLYYKIGIYKSAVVSLGTFLDRYPSGKFSEEATFIQFQAQYNLAKNSVLRLQKERYNTALEFYYGFIDRFPDSKFKKDAEELYDRITERLKNFQS
ncbi:MAG: outer membrane protein assembly factor BamD [Sporocytophaga sp.]|nr:outer membrane protein assembly factor BamD [Sporocytophaga sp.]